MGGKPHPQMVGLWHWLYHINHNGEWSSINRDSTTPAKVNSKCGLTIPQIGDGSWMNIRKLRKPKQFSCEQKGYSVFDPFPSLDIFWLFYTLLPAFVRLPKRIWESGMPIWSISPCPTFLGDVGFRFFRTHVRISKNQSPHRLTLFALRRA